MDRTFLCNSIIHFTYGCSNLNPSTVIFNINVNGSKELEVKEDKWETSSVREAFIVMATASNSDLQSKLSATNDCGLCMGINEGCDYNKWF